MSADWFYMRSGWFHRAKRIGPITEQDFLAQIDRGKISPDTLVQSKKTRNKWVPMSSVGPAMKRWLDNNPDHAKESAGKAS
ncbi:MAG: DUF4339 domain-containing protein [Planctomycetota bacterium]